MIAASAVQREVLQAIDGVALPWLRGNSMQRLILADPPIESTHIRVTRRKARALRDKGRSQDYLQRRAWPREGLNSSNFPVLIFIVDGEADLRIGTTTDMMVRKPNLSNAGGEWVVELPAVSCLVLPSGVPISDSTRPHWERLQVENAKSRILWVHILPEAAVCHICTTQGHQHQSPCSVLVGDSQLAPLMESLLTELSMSGDDSEEIAQSVLLALMLRVRRGLAGQRQVVVGPEAIMASETVASTPVSMTATTLDRACRFVHAHLGSALTLDLIAASAHISASQLKRLFRSEMGMTVMQYVTQRRIEAARFYLENTDMPIKEIATEVGYPHASHFSTVFTQEAGASPREFRKGQSKRPRRTEK